MKFLAWVERRFGELSPGLLCALWGVGARLRRVLVSR